jgi:hypothetical protein
MKTYNLFIFLLHLIGRLDCLILIDDKNYLMGTLWPYLVGYMRLPMLVHITSPFVEANYQSSPHWESIRIHARSTTP